MRVVRDDWLLCTIWTVESVMEQHGFVEDITPAIKPSAQESVTTWDKLLRRLNQLSLS